MRPPAPERENYKTAEEAEAAEDDYYASLTPEQRMEIFFEILAKARNYAELRGRGGEGVSTDNFMGQLRHDDAGNEIEEPWNDPKVS